MRHILVFQKLVTSESFRLAVGTYYNEVLTSTSSSIESTLDSTTNFDPNVGAKSDTYIKLAEESCHFG